jgi:hypothetical protein
MAQGGSCGQWCPSIALTMCSRSASNTRFQPVSTVSTHSVSGRNVTQGTVKKYASLLHPTRIGQDQPGVLF